MERKLGRGLGSLLGQTNAVEEHKGPSSIAVDRIRPNPNQPRKTFDPVHLEELVDSILRHGVLQPIVVRPRGDDFELVSGERRWRATQRAGLQTIPAVVRTDIADEQMLELAMVENLQRQDLDAMERARGYQQMMESLHITQEQVAEKVGLKRATVANHMRLLELPSQAQEAVRRGMISMGHARALLGLSEAPQILELVEKIVRQDLSVRDVERIVRESSRGKPSKDTLQPKASGQAWIAEVETQLRERLGTKVSIKNRPGYRGEIVIEYFNRVDLDRLIQELAPREEL